MSSNLHADGCAWVAGDYLPVREAAMPLLDWGLLRSDLTYDVVGVVGGRFFRLEDHLDRLLRGCERLGLTPPLDRGEIRDVLAGCVRRSGLREAYVEAIVTRGIPPAGSRDPRAFEARFYAYAIPYVWIASPEQQRAGIDLVIARDATRIPASSVDPTVKNFHWGDLTRGLFEAYERDAWLSVLTDGDETITEGPGVNVFLVAGDELRTPDRGVLEGITRRTVLEIAHELGIPARVERVTADELRAADEIFLTSTAGGVMPVRSIDDRALGGAPGPTTSEIRERYWAWHEDPRHSTAVDYDMVDSAP